MKILVATEKPFAAAAVNGIKNAAEADGHELVLLEKYTDKQQLLDAVKDADAMIVRSDKITKEVLDAATKLKIVVRAGAGYDSIDTAYAKEKGIVVENTPGQNSNAVAELVFGMLVYAVRNFFNGKAGSELKGKKLGILAFGNVGRNVAASLKGSAWRFMLSMSLCQPTRLRRKMFMLQKTETTCLRLATLCRCTFPQPTRPVRASTMMLFPKWERRRSHKHGTQRSNR